MTLNVVHSTELDTWIAQRHYLHSTPAGAVLRMEFLDNGRRIGGMLWGRPTAPKLDQARLLQLTRMYFVDDTESFVESRALAMARKHIRTHQPRIKGLITYASTGMGHEGTIYLADGWYPLGLTKGGNWENRSGRTNRDSSDKIRFTRSP